MTESKVAVEEAISAISWVHKLSGLPLITELLFAPQLIIERTYVRTRDEAVVATVMVEAVITAVIIVPAFHRRANYLYFETLGYINHVSRELT